VLGALARFFLGVAQGLNVVNKAVADPEMLRDIARTAMKVWDEAGVARQPGSIARQRKGPAAETLARRSVETR
jgi:hypothetical protein